MLFKATSVSFNLFINVHGKNVQENNLLMLDATAKFAEKKGWYKRLGLICRTRKFRQSVSKIK